MDENTRKLMYPKDRKEYHEAFLETYKQDKWKNKLISDFGEKYYLKVMEIYKERLENNDFMIGPQTVSEWEELKKSL